MLGIHQLAVSLVVPPHEAEVTLQHGRAGVHVAGDALARWNRGREFVLDRMAGFVLGDRRIGVLAQPTMPRLSVRAGVHRRAIVGIDDVTRRATARPIIAGVIVGAEEVERRVEQTSLLQPNENRVGAVLSTESAIAQTCSRTARFFACFRNTDFRTKASAPFKDAENVAGLSDLKARQRIEERDDPFVFHLVLSRRGNGLQTLRRAVHGIALAELSTLLGEAAVVVERRLPEHRPVSHHALANFEYFARMTAGRAATDVSNPQVARIDEANEFRPLVIEQRVGADGIRGRGPYFGKTARDVTLQLVGRARIAAVTVGATEVHRRLVVHVAAVAMTFHAAPAFRVSLAIRLQHQAVGGKARDVQL